MQNEIQKLVDDLNSAEPRPIPEAFSSVDKMIDAAYEYAQRTIVGSENESEDESTMLPTWVLVTQTGQSVIIASPFSGGPAAKDMIAEGIKKLMQEAHVVRYTFTSEAWVATSTDRPSAFSQPPSERNDRKEVLMITGGDRLNGEKMRFYDIVRDADGEVTELKFNKEMEGGSSEGRFSGLLEVARH